MRTYWQEKSEQVDRRLQELLLTKEVHPALIHDAMRYSVLAGGKRLRPVLTMAAAEAVGGRAEDVIDAACAIELIHTYSLIHDDLPAMDNDDYRRGKLTNHKVYGEGVAILAGDALLTYAFEVLSKMSAQDPTLLLTVIREIAEAAGTLGMIGGQVVDLQSEGQLVDLQTLEYIHRAKTGALYRASLRAGAILGGGSPQQLQCLTEYADHFGLVFQITDDILDVIGDEQRIGKPVGSDIKNHKATYPSIFTLPVAQRMAEETIEKAIQCLDQHGMQGNFLRYLVKYLATRDQ